MPSKGRSIMDLKSNKAITMDIKWRVTKEASFDSVMVCFTKLASNYSLIKNGCGQKEMGWMIKASWSRFGRWKIMGKKDLKKGDNGIG